MEVELFSTFYAFACTKIDDLFTGDELKILQHIQLQTVLKIIFLNLIYSDQQPLENIVKGQV